MITFLIGMAILVVGGLIYGRVTERAFRPTDEPTPAVAHPDGVDFVPMKEWKNGLIELLNIAGTGPIIGPLQGILFGPIAFITIPIGCVIAGAVHDYMSGMISIRHNGAQMPDLIRHFLGKYMHHIYLVAVSLLLLLIGVMFIYTPGDLFVTHILNQDHGVTNPLVWIVYGAIFVYYIVATLFPIDKIIGKIYPVFGAILILSAVGVFIGIFVKGYPLVELWDMASANFPLQGNFIPIFFVTVTCGICSGFHSTQATLISRTVCNEKEGRATFYDMMLVEGFIAMTWAAAGMGVLQLGMTDTATMTGSTANVVGLVAKDMLGNVGGVIAIIGVIVLPITSGDTALRSLRLVIGDTLHIDQTKKSKALRLALAIFIVVAALLVWAKIDPAGFGIAWRYMSWANEASVVFAFAMIAVYMKRHKMPYIMAVVPGAFYTYVVTAYILNAKIGFHLPWLWSYIVAGVLTLVAVIALLRVKPKPKKKQKQAVLLFSVENARELGGYRVGDTTIKEGVLLRAGSLARASMEDIHMLKDDYRLGALVDFRMELELKQEPDPEVPGASYHPLPVMELTDFPGVEDEELARFLNSDMGRMEMIETSVERGMMDPNLYESFVMTERGKKAYREFFRVLLELPEDRAVLWHCTDGKDRTGVAAMLLLTALGADRETILSDYLLTNTYNAKRIQQMKFRVSSMKLDPETEKKMLFGMGGVFEEYLACAMSAIEEHYDSIENYLETELGVGENERQALRTKYLV